MTGDAKISIRNVSKVFGQNEKHVLSLVKGGTSKSDVLAQTGHVLGINNVSLDIAPGETSVIMGLSGSGKSTLIRHINRLIEPTDGKILFEGRDILEFDERRLRDFRRHNVAMVFQNFGLLPHRNVIDNVAYPLLISGTAKSAAHNTAMGQLEQVGLAGFEQKYPNQLSGGMRQRVGLARALATNADVLLMDEAFSALDPLIRNDMQKQLKDLQARLHKTIVFITHDLDEALLLGDRISILKDGELRQSGTRHEILMRPADDYVKRFVRDVNRARVVSLESAMLPCRVLSGSKPTDVQLHKTDASTSAVAWVDGSTGKIHAATREQLAAGNSLAEVAAVRHDAVLEDAFPLLSGCANAVAVTGNDGAIVGLLTKTALIHALTQGEGPASHRTL